MTTEFKRPTLGIAFIPILILIGLLALNVVLFSDDASYGPNQIALMVASTICALLAATLGFKWKHLLDGISKSIGSTVPAIIILLLIGALTGTWLLSGVIPTMIYYGLEIIHPSIFLFAACLVSSIVSLATGSSWSTVGTVGIALLGIGETMGFSSGLVAGAIISGAYFGDKMSPLSDTTNLAPAMAGTDLFTHIRHMSWTTVPSITIAFIFFLVVGFSFGGEYHAERVDEILLLLEGSFNISPILFIVPIGVIVLILLKVPAIPALFTGAILGALFGLTMQPEVVRGVGEKVTVTLTVDNPDVASVVWDDGTEGKVLEYQQAGIYGATLFDENGTDIDRVEVEVFPIQMGSGFGGDTKEFGRIVDVDNAGTVYKGKFEPTSYLSSAYSTVLIAMYGSIAVDCGDENVNDLLSSDGMSGMLNTIWLIVTAMSFGGVMERSGMLERITDAILTFVKSTGSLIASTVGTCLFFNVTAADQYLAIVVPGRMFASEYRERGLRPENLSRTLEDSGTVTSALIPWNTCGAYHSSTLGVAVGDYWMFAIFNLVSPIMTTVYGYLGFKVPHYTEEELLELEQEEND